MRLRQLLSRVRQLPRRGVRNLVVPTRDSFNRFAYRPASSTVQNIPYRYWNAEKGELQVEQVWNAGDDGEYAMRVIMRGRNYGRTREARLNNFANFTHGVIRGPHYDRAWIDEPIFKGDVYSTPEQAQASSEFLFDMFRRGCLEEVAEVTPSPSTLKEPYVWPDFSDFDYAAYEPGDRLLIRGELVRNWLRRVFGHYGVEQ